MVNHLVSSEMLDIDRQELEMHAAKLAARGDTGSLATIYELYRDRLIRSLDYSFRGYPPAEDLAQETFLKAFTAIESKNFTYRGPHSMYGWLLRIATNTGISVCRRNNRQIPIDFQEHDRPAAGDFTEDVVGQDFVDGLLSTLSPARADIVRAVDVEGRAYKEYAQDNALSIGTVASRLHRARNDLRQNLEQQDPAVQE